MRAAVLGRRGIWTVEDVPDPIPERGELLVRTRVSSVCGSDVHKVRYAESGLPPGAPGHESVGVVITSRDVRFREGDTVLCVPQPSIARGFAELQTVGGDFAVPLPSGQPDGLVLAQQMGTCIFAMKRFWPSGLCHQDQTAAVIGAGPAGIAFVVLLRRAGFSSVIVSDTSPLRLEAARSLGATASVLAPAESITAAVETLTQGRGADLVVEASGRNATRHQAMRVVGMGGRVGLFGLPENQEDCAIPFAHVFRRNASIEMASGAQREPALTSFTQAVTLLIGNPQIPATLMTHRMPLDEIGTAFAMAADPRSGAIKVCISFG